MDAISSRSDWEDEYKSLVEDIERLHSAPAVTRLSLLRDGKPFGSVEVGEDSSSGVIDGVTPADARVAFTFWAAELNKEMGFKVDLRCKTFDKPAGRPHGWQNNHIDEG